MKKRRNKRAIGGAERTNVTVGRGGLRAELTVLQADAIGRQLRDLFSPVVEGAGLIGDYIRYFRQAAAVRAIEKVRTVAEQNDILLRPVAPRFLVPWIEAVSIEDPDSPLLDWWANLLLTKIIEKSTRPYLLDVMGRLGPQEAQFLDRMWMRYRKMCAGSNLSVADAEFAAILFAGKVKERIDPLLSRVRELDQEGGEFVTLSNDIGSEMHILSQIADDLGTPLILSVPLSFHSGGPGHRREQISKSLAEAGATVDVCKGINLVRENTYFEPFPGLIGIQARYEIVVTIFTDLGIEFMSACQSRGAV